jgi:hypothetical protein
VSGSALGHLLPGLYFLLLGAGLAAALARWYDAVPRWTTALFLALPLALFWQALAGDRILLPLGVLGEYVPFRGLPPDPDREIFLQRDLVHQIAPWTLEVKRALLAGRWPLWNRLAGAGMPLMGDPQSQPFQPLVLLGYPFSVYRAAAVSAALRVHLALVFTFLLLRRQGLGAPPALAGSLAFGLGSFMMLWLGWPIANAAALLPVALYAMASCDRRGARRDFALLAAAAASLLLAGHPETMLYALALAGLFLASRVAARRAGGRLRLLGGAALALAIGAGVAAPPLLLAQSYLPTTGRAAAMRYRLARRPLAELWQELQRPATLAAWGQRSLSRLLPSAAPHAQGDQVVAYWGYANYFEDAGGFAGTGTLLAALLAVPAAAAAPLAAGPWRGSPPAGRPAAGGPCRPGRFPQERLMLAVLAGSVLVLAQPPGFENLVARLPLAGATAIHANGRLQLLVGFCLAYLAACQLERWTRREPAGGGAGANGAAAPGTAAEENGGAAAPGTAAEENAAAGPRPGAAAWRWFAPGPLAVALAAAGLAAVIAWGYLGHLLPVLDPRQAADLLRWLWAQEALLAAAALALGWLAARARAPTRAPAPAAGRRRWAAWAFCGLVGGELLALHGGSNPSSPERLAFPVTPPVAFLVRHLGNDRMVGMGRAFPANFPAAYGLDDVRIDNPSAPWVYLQAVAGIDTPHSPVPLFGRPGHPLYDLLGVRWVVTRPGAKLPLPAAFRDAAGWVFERPRPLPRLFLPERIQIDQGQWGRGWLENNDDFALRALVSFTPAVGRHWRAGEPAASRVAVVAVSSERVRGRATLAERRLLAASVYQDGGWRVLAGGAPRAGVLVDGAFAGAWLDPGSWDVELIYRPPLLLAGCLLTALAMALGCAWWVPAPERAPVLSWKGDGR